MMKVLNKKRAVLVLVALNLLLAAALMAGPAVAQLLPVTAFSDCCKGEICCDNCCFFTADCDEDRDCRIN